MKDHLETDAEAQGGYIKGEADAVDQAAGKIGRAFEAICNDLEHSQGIIVDLVDRLIALEARVKALEAPHP